jgi:hypothetical protein
MPNFRVSHLLINKTLERSQYFISRFSLQVRQEFQKVRMINHTTKFNRQVVNDSRQHRFIFFHRQTDTENITLKKRTACLPSTWMLCNATEITCTLTNLHCRGDKALMMELCCIIYIQNRINCSKWIYEIAADVRNYDTKRNSRKFQQEVMQ